MQILSLVFFSESYQKVRRGDLSIPLCYFWKQEDNSYGYKQVLTSSDIFSNANYIDDKNFENLNGRGFRELYLNCKMFIVLKSQKYKLGGSFGAIHSNTLILEMLKLRLRMVQGVIPVPQLLSGVQNGPRRCSNHTVACEL